MRLTRRELGRLAAGFLPAAAAFASPTLAAARQRKAPASRYAGVQIGMNVPYNFGGRDMAWEELLDRCVRLGVSAVELRSQPVESFLGSPARNSQKPARETVRRWRASVSIDRANEFRSKYESAGVSIEIVKYDGIYEMADVEVDYCFELARALGARAISCEIDLAHTARIGRFADKHRMMVGYHGHAETKPSDWESAFGQSSYNGANVDLGHFVAGNNTSPIPFIERHHARITHVHVKDRKRNDGPNVPFGEGDTPITEALRLIRDNKWPIQATIELEYPIPEGSDRMKELARTIDYCRRALLA